MRLFTLSDTGLDEYFICFWLPLVLKTDAAILIISMENNCSRKVIRYNSIKSHGSAFPGASGVDNWVLQLPFLFGVGSVSVAEHPRDTATSVG